MLRHVAIHHSRVVECVAWWLGGARVAQGKAMHFTMFAVARAHLLLLHGAFAAVKSEPATNWPGASGPCPVGMHVLMEWVHVVFGALARCHPSLESCRVCCLVAWLCPCGSRQSHAFHSGCCLTCTSPANAWCICGGQPATKRSG